MAVQISGTTVIDNSRQLLNVTGINATGGAGVVTATSFSGSGANLTNIATFAAGTLMLFQQTAAPTGWTKQTTHDNKALRVVSGAASSGGTSAFTSVFASRTPAGTVTMTNAAVTLTTAQIPGHTHSYTASNDNNVQFPNNYGPKTPIGSANSGTGGSSTGTNAGGGGSHTHANTATFSGTALDFAVQYVDLIIASKI